MDWARFNPTTPALESNSTSLHRRHLGRVAGRSVMFLLVVFVATQLLIKQAEQNITHIRQEIGDVMVSEAWNEQAQNMTLAHSGSDIQPLQNWQSSVAWNQVGTPDSIGADITMLPQAIQDVELQGDLALVEVTMTGRGTSQQTAPYREVRFYRQTEDGWRRTAPQASFWGPQLQSRTPHFRFSYHQRDQQAVEMAITQIESLYVDLRHDLGLGEPETQKTLAIEVAIGDDLPVDLFGLAFVGDKVAVPSPLLLQVPEGLTYAEVLRQSIAVPLIAYTFDELLSARQQPKCGWQALVDGFSRWLQWEDVDLPSWYRQTLDINLRQWLLENPYPKLAQIAPITTSGVGCCPNSCGYGHTDSRMQRIILAETLIDYAVTAYGREDLRLIDGLRQHDTWESLIPAVFGVSAKEFESGWHAYLSKRYGIQDADVPAQ